LSVYNDFIKLLDKHNICYIVRGREIQFTCLWHKDSRPSASFNLDKKVFICFACGAKGTLRDIIMKLNGTVEDAKDNNKQNIVDKISLLFKKENEKHKQIEVLNTNILENFKTRNYDYLLKRGFEKDILIEFNIGFDNKTSRITIPIFDEKNRLRAIFGRRIIDNDSPKYIPLLPKKNFKKSHVLFGLNKIDLNDNIGILVEGHLDVIRAFQCGFRNTMAIQGSNISDEQVCLILKRFDKLIIAMDNDNAGERATRKIIDKIKRSIILYKFKYCSQDIKDIGEMNSDQIQYGIDNKEIIA